MGSRHSIRTEAQIERRIKQGRGQGEGIHYIPWIKVHEISSLGRSHKVPGNKIARTHHLLSDLEWKYFLIAEFSRDIVDIREQFPLLPRQSTIDTATQLGIRYPVYPTTIVPVVMTTDFLLTVVDARGNPYLVARSTKYVEDLGSKRTMEKLEIEKRFWRERNVDWALITEKSIPETLIDTLNWLRQGGKLPERLLDPALLCAVLTEFHIYASPGVPLKIILKQITKKLGLSLTDATWLFKHLGWNQRISLNLDHPLHDLMAPIFLLTATKSKKSSLMIA